MRMLACYLCALFQLPDIFVIAKITAVRKEKLVSNYMAITRSLPFEGSVNLECLQAFFKM